MGDSRAFIDRLEAADTEELAEIVHHPTLEQEDDLRAYLGAACYQRLHSLSLKQALQQATSPQANVVVIPGITGTVLSSETGSGEVEAIWPRALPIMDGKLDRLMLADDGRSEADAHFAVRPTGISKRLYGELLLSLSLRWRVHAFWYDWRKDLRQVADELAAFISATFGDTPVHLVGHSVGGLVARTYIERYPTRWTRTDPTTGPARLVMIGTPNFGTFAFLQPFLGLGPTIEMLEKLDSHHDMAFFCRLVSSFPGLYQLLPFLEAPAFASNPRRMAFVEKLYQADTYRLYGGAQELSRELSLSRVHLRSARDYHADLAGQLANADTTRWLYIAGDDRPTIEWMGDMDAAEPRAYFGDQAIQVTRRGDGIVPHTLGALPGAATLYVTSDHGGLVSHPDVLNALDALLAGEAANMLSATPSAAPGYVDAAELKARHQADRETIDAVTKRTRAWSSPGLARGRPIADEREIEQILSRNVLTFQQAPDQTERPELPGPVASIRVQLIHGGIDAIHDDPRLSVPVDAVAVGHYVGVFPTEHSAEGRLDNALSAALVARSTGGQEALKPTDRLLWKYTERGTLQGELGQVFVLPDPRSGPERPAATDRIIAIAGMGLPGRFGVPELTVMVRELCWALGRLGRRHLATVLIGAGANNLSVADAVNGWIRGIKYAITGTVEGDPWRLTCLTFVEADPIRIQALDQAIQREKKRLEDDRRLVIEYEYFPPANDQDAKPTPQAEPAAVPDEKTPTRVTVTSDRTAYRFGAVTQSASIPEREIALDPRLVVEANDELVAEDEPRQQVDRGQFMAKLLLPHDLWGHFFTDAPLVMMLDRTTARVHWEMIAQPDLLPISDTQARQHPDDLWPYFLGTSRGFTRQLRTTFAPPPDPPLSRRRLLRVLVVADPAADMHLPGAEEEGIEVADLFESFNRLTDTDNRVEVVRLFGPREASRLNVLHHLINRSYDVLHFAGHCAYDEKDPSASGWIFTDGERLTANEMRRIDRIPNFVFSNACESGVTPDEPGRRAAGLAPSFAESFFERGVSNFVCTAWPVYDSAARRFALSLYGQLLGIDPSSGTLRSEGPQPMYHAMQEARRAIFNPEGARTWGAYQHYGNPYLRFFQPTDTRGQGGSADATAIQPTPQAGG